jgi:hypothetical protein
MEVRAILYGGANEPLAMRYAFATLDDLDKELERRGHFFCRYADDVNLYLSSRQAGERVRTVSRPAVAPYDRILGHENELLSVAATFGMITFEYHPSSLVRPETGNRPGRYRTISCPNDYVCLWVLFSSGFFLTTRPFS